MLRRAGVALVAAQRNRILLDSVVAGTPIRPHYGQGKERMEYDQPARWAKWAQKLYWLSDDEREDFVEEPYVGVDHLYEAHFGSKENPVVIEQMGIHGNDIFVGCLGGCHLDAADGTAYYQAVPPNTLAVCTDCGIHFVARCNEQLTFWPDGTQPWEKVDFATVEASIYKHLKYGSPLMI